MALHLRGSLQQGMQREVHWQSWLLCGLAQPLQEPISGASILGHHELAGIGERPDTSAWN